MQLPSSISDDEMSRQLPPCTGDHESPINSELPLSVHTNKADTYNEGSPIEDCRDDNSIGSDSDFPCSQEIDGLNFAASLGTDDEGMNGFDDANDPDDLWVDDCGETLEPHPTNYDVPPPEVAKMLRMPQPIAEYYSRPRLLLETRRRGLLGVLSLDLVCGWNFCQQGHRIISMDLLEQLCVVFLMLSPPCTVFSDLQRLFNIKRIRADIWSERWEQGMIHLSHSMDCARTQLRRRAFFAFEHPARASSWEQPVVKHVESMDGVYVVQFDFCMLGLESMIFKMPVRKRTKVMTNSKMLADALAPFQCDKQHQHQCIQGNEGGVSRALHAQVYPDQFVKLVANVACALSGCRSL